MEKAYSPAIHDKKWQEIWDDNRVSDPHAAQAQQSFARSESFTIMMPPPNVTGVLHQGHAVMLALEDALVRWHRMKGFKTLYLPGSDHAAIAVQMQVVKHLEKKGVDYRELGREAFLKECWDWIEHYRPRIFSQIKAMGVSCDWSRVKFTLDQDLNEAVKEAFVRMYEKGHIYRAERLVNWSPKGQTVLSDLEVIFEEKKTQLWHLRYPLKEDPSRYLVVSTTRPETMLGDTAVAVHPEDERYKDLIGQKIQLPIVGREIPIVADDFVDREFGTGAVKITPAHDFNDFEVGKKHQLPFVNILTKDAKIVSGLTGEAAEFSGLDRFEARTKIVEKFQEKSLLEGIDDYTTRIGTSERWGDVVEPYLSYQWFCSMESLARNVVKEFEAGDLDFSPDEFRNQFMRWMENIQDWCVSRQLWWGHQIPAYHCKETGEIVVSSEAPKNEAGKTWEQDADVLDTWFSSALWPFSTLGWPNEESPDFREFYPNQILETGFDILFFWVARMLMMGKELTGKIPFSKVLLHPMVRDAQGQKMSKSKGNVIDPLEIVEELGADTLRMTLHGLCVQGRDIRLSSEQLQAYRNFINKLWNATKFVLMDQSVKNNSWKERPQPKDLASRWILSRLDECVKKVNHSWENFRIKEAADTLYHFLWEDFCDWYLESAKASREESQSTLLHVLGQYLKLLHPICPHVTEELWHQLPGVPEEELISLEQFPEFREGQMGEVIEFEYLRSLISSIRNVRAENSIKPSLNIEIFADDLSDDEKVLIEKEEKLIQLLAKVEKISWNSTAAAPSTQIVFPSLVEGKTSAFSLSLGELVDVAEETQRLEKEIKQIQGYIVGLERKLANRSFVENAPEAVVNKERDKLSQARDKCAKLEIGLVQLQEKA